MVKGAGHGQEYTIIGLDVHAETIAVAVAEGREKVQALGTIPNRPEAVRRLGKPGDRRDAERLASSYQAGTLTVVWVPEPKHEALRDLVRAREAAKQDLKRAKHRLGKYLLRYGQRPVNSSQRTSRPTEENPRVRCAAQDPRAQCEAAPDE
ncbi:MAG TPA: hypothetical protein VHB79_33605 [Polyangiaceae bacterium]|nr:hypothetical protein [Polyangiaceae bacterium]